MRVLIKCYLMLSLIGAVLSVRRGRSPRLLGIRLPGTPTVHALTAGSPLSAPPAMLIALIIALRKERFDVITVLAAMFMFGIAGEADSVAAIRRPGADPINTALVVLDFAVPAAMLVEARRICVNRRG